MSDELKFTVISDRNATVYFGEEKWTIIQKQTKNFQAY